jgi:hypothetical protein
MALIYIDSFDHYSTAQITQKWNVGNGSINSGTGRCGTDGFNTGVPTSVNFKTFQYPAPADDTIIVGFARKNTSGGQGSFFHVGNVSESSPVSLTQNSDQTISLFTGATSVGPSTSYSTQVDVWNYYEIKIVFSDTVGSIDVRIDGVLLPEMSVSGVDTLNFALPWTRIGFRGLSGSGSQVFDDLYVADGTGGVNDVTDFLGDVHVTAVLPQTDAVAPGNHQDWGLSTGSDHGALVDDNPNDGDTTYIISGTPGDQDTFNFPDIKLTSGTVYGVQTGIYARKDDVGERIIRALARHAGTTDVHATDRVIGSDTYKNYITMYRQNPVGGGAWTIADVNDSEFGVKLQS